MVPLFFIILGATWGVQLEVFSRLSDFGDIDVISSTNVRLYFPIITMFDVLQQYPLFGIGIGNKKALVSISSIYSASSNYHLLNENILLGSFAISRILTYFGLLGAWIFLVIIYKTVLPISFAQLIKFSVSCSVLVLSIGPFESVYFWCLLAICYRCILTGETYNTELKHTDGKL